jgi:hypothetical protein
LSKSSGLHQRSSSLFHGRNKVWLIVSFKALHWRKGMVRRS